VRRRGLRRTAAGSEASTLAAALHGSFQGGSRSYGRGELQGSRISWERGWPLRLASG